MCTMIAKQIPIDGSGKGKDGWFEVRQLNVSYDHPYHAKQEHALNIDFVNEAEGPGARVAVELTPQAARQLAQTIHEIFPPAPAGGGLGAGRGGGVSPLLP